MSAIYDLKSQNKLETLNIYPTTKAKLRTIKLHREKKQGDGKKVFLKDIVAEMADKQYKKECEE